MSEDGSSNGNGTLGAFRWVIALNALSTLIELIGGVQSASLGILANVAMGSWDVILLFLNYWGLKQEEQRRRKCAWRFAVVSDGLLILISVEIILEALRRLTNVSPQHVQGLPLLIVAGISLIVNLWALAIYPRKNGHGEKSTNIRSGLFKVVNGIAFCAAGFIDGLVVTFTRWQEFDCYISVAISATVIVILTLSFKRGNK